MEHWVYTEGGKLLVLTGMVGIAWKVFSLAHDLQKALSTMQAMFKRGTMLETQMGEVLEVLNSYDEGVASSQEKIDDLHDWHDKEDGEGVKIWYVRHSLERSLDSLTVAIGRLIDKDAKTLALLEKISARMSNL